MIMDEKESDVKEVTFDLPSEDVDTESGYVEYGDISESKTSLSSDSSFSPTNGSEMDISPEAEISHVSEISSHISEISSPVSLQSSTSTPQSSSRERVYIDKEKMIARIRKKKSKNNSQASISSSDSRSDLGSQLSLPDGPDQIKVPIIGFEVMEERTKFTVGNSKILSFMIICVQQVMFVIHRCKWTSR